jgi:hypothetical protein
VKPGFKCCFGKTAFQRWQPLTRARHPGAAAVAGTLRELTQSFPPLGFVSHPPVLSVDVAVGVDSLHQRHLLPHSSNAYRISF